MPPRHPPTRKGLQPYSVQDVSIQATLASLEAVRDRTGWARATTVAQHLDLALPARSMSVAGRLKWCRAHGLVVSMVCVEDLGAAGTKICGAAYWKLTYRGTLVAHGRMTLQRVRELVRLGQ